MKNEKESWYSNLNGQVISKKDFFSLYMRYHESMDNTLNRHFNVRNYYTVMLSALFGLYVGGSIQLEINNVPKLSTPYYGLVALLFAIIVLSVFAIKSTTRYYVSWLRKVALLAKIENILGIDSQVKIKEKKPEELIWKKDKRFMDKYYLDSRKTCESSEEFIKEKKRKGDNMWAVLTFVAFGILSTILLFFTYTSYVS